MDKKGVLFLVFVLLMFIFSFVAAEEPDTGKIVENVKKFFTPILEAIFGKGEVQYIFEQLLFALIIIAFVYMALDRVPIISQNAFALWTATIAMAILSVRFIVTEKLTKLLFVPQGVTGIALLTIIPFVVFFWFIEFGVTSKTLRKFGWAAYSSVWIIIWYKQIFTESSPLAGVGEWGYLYLLSAGIGILCLIFDGTITKYRKRIKAEKTMSAKRYLLYSKLMKDRDEASEAYADFLKRGETISADAIKKQIDSIDKAINKIMP